ncbi:MAG: TetR/AcrR family transcriptional regulator [Acidimicrobiia bacterium]
MADDNRAKILDVAVAMIDDGGEAALRVNHIVATVGVTPPVLYYHFGSRDGLVIAAQIERYTRRVNEDIAAIGRAVSSCASADDLRRALVISWKRSLAERSENRWRRANVVGSAYARPELTEAVATAQDEIVEALVEILEPCQERGWLRPGIDLASTVAWHHSVLIGRIYIEHGQQQGDPDEWNRLTIEALEWAFFGS